MTDQITTELPRYRSHAVIHAVRIGAVEFQYRPIDRHPGIGLTLITPADERYAPFTVEAPYADRQQPRAGGWYIKEKDGSEHFLPNDQFASEYSPV